jgi:hypothetical protein
MGRSYTIAMNPPAPGAIQPQHCRAVGRWPASFDVMADGARPPTRLFRTTADRLPHGRAGHIQKELFSFSDRYDLVVGPHQDVLLMMAITACIDRIHEEIRRDD